MISNHSSSSSSSSSSENNTLIKELFRAVKSSHTQQAIKLITEMGENDKRTQTNELITHVTATDEEGWTLLHYASNNDNLDLVWFLLDNGAQVNAKDNNNDTALHWAVINENYEMVGILLRKGADTLIENKDGETPLKLAQNSKNIKIIKCLTSQTVKKTTRHTKSSRSLKKIVDSFKLNDAEKGEFFAAEFLAYKRKESKLILYAAAKEGAHVMGLILEKIPKKKLDLAQIKDEIGRTALHRAAFHYQNETIKLLLEKEQMLINMKDRRGRTAFFLAADRRKIATTHKINTAKILLENGTNPYITPHTIFSSSIYRFNHALILAFRHSGSAHQLISNIAKVLKRKVYQGLNLASLLSFPLDKKGNTILHGVAQRMTELTDQDQITHQIEMLAYLLILAKNPDPKRMDGIPLSVSHKEEFEVARCWAPSLIKKYMKLPELDINNITEAIKSYLAKRSSTQEKAPQFALANNNNAASSSSTASNGSTSAVTFTTTPSLAAASSPAASSNSVTSLIQATSNSSSSYSLKDSDNTHKATTSCWSFLACRTTSQSSKKPQNNSTTTQPSPSAIKTPANNLS